MHITTEALKALEAGRDRTAICRTGSGLQDEHFVITIGVPNTVQDLSDWHSTIAACPCQICEMLLREMDIALQVEPEDG